MQMKRNYASRSKAMQAAAYSRAANECEAAGYTLTAELNREMLDPKWGLVPRPPREKEPRRTRPVRDRQSQQINHNTAIVRGGN